MSTLLIAIALFIALQLLGVVYQRELDKIFFLRSFLFVGIFIHEFSHYIFCKIMRAPVEEFRVGLRQGHVIHGKPLVPFIGSFFISLAPLLVGIGAAMAIFVWQTGISYEEARALPDTVRENNWQALWMFAQDLLRRIDFTGWQFGVALFLLLNVLATFVPSKQDFKNIAGLVALYFVASVFVEQMATINIFMAIALGGMFILQLLMTILLFLLNLIKGALGMRGL